MAFRFRFINDGGSSEMTKLHGRNKRSEESPAYGRYDRPRHNFSTACAHKTNGTHHTKQPNAANPHVHQHTYNLLCFRRFGKNCTLQSAKTKSHLPRWDSQLYSKFHAFDSPLSHLLGGRLDRVNTCSAGKNKKQKTTTKNPELSHV